MAASASASASASVGGGGQYSKIPLKKMSSQQLKVVVDNIVNSKLSSEMKFKKLNQLSEGTRAKHVGDYSLKQIVGEGAKRLEVQARDNSDYDIAQKAKLLADRIKEQVSGKPPSTAPKKVDKAHEEPSE